MCVCDVFFHFLTWKCCPACCSVRVPPDCAAVRLNMAWTWWAPPGTRRLLPPSDQLPSCRDSALRSCSPSPHHRHRLLLEVHSLSFINIHAKRLELVDSGQLHLTSRALQLMSFNRLQWTQRPKLGGCLLVLMEGPLETEACGKEW